MQSLAFSALCCLLIIGYTEASCRFEPDGTFLPDPSSRQRFIWCWNGQETVGYCAPGEEFNPFDRVCERPQWGPPPQTTTQPPRDACFNRPDGTFLPDPSSRRHFFWCSAGRSIQGDCGVGMAFDPIDGVCEADRGVQPTPPTGRDPCFNRPDNTFLPDPSSRQRFLFCQGGVSTPAYCPDGMLFDPVDLFCDYPNAPTTTRAPPPPPTRTTTRAPPPPPTRTTTRAPPPPPTRTTTRAGQQPPTRQTTRAGPPGAPTRAPLPNRNAQPVTRATPPRPQATRATPPARG